MKKSKLGRKGLPIRHALRDELSWTHYRFLLKVEGEDARVFYMNEAVNCNWNTRTLERQINSSYYERLVMTSEQVFASKYKTFLPTEEELQKEINRELKIVEAEEQLETSSGG